MTISAVIYKAMSYLYRVVTQVLSWKIPVELELGIVKVPVEKRDGIIPAGRKFRLLLAATNLAIIMASDSLYLATYCQFSSLLYCAQCQCVAKERTPTTLNI